jgi:hypothetical protein
VTKVAYAENLARQAQPKDIAAHIRESMYLASYSYRA